MQASPSGATIKVSFQPNADGSFRVICGSPMFNGGSASSVASTLLGSDATAASATLQSGHLAWWHAYWNRLGLVKIELQRRQRRIHREPSQHLLLRDGRREPGPAA